jgi:peptide/nickel transport system ATP-binding protein
MESLLEVRNLCVRYRTHAAADLRALIGVDLLVAPREIVGVLGESGSGKSTLAASVLAMFPANAVVDDGAVLLMGTNLLKLDRSELASVRGRRVSLIYQEPGMALHPTMRVGAQIEEVLRAHSADTKAESHRKVRKLLETIFPAEADRVYSSYPHQLSGGQRQRIAIAQAIACEPSLLIADEPTASLDPVTQREILDLLKKLQKERDLAIVFITHSAELLDGFADRIVVMYAGRIIEEASARSVLKSPQHPYTQALLRCRPVLLQVQNSSNSLRIPVIPGEAPDLSGKVPGCAFEPRCPDRMQLCRERAPQFSKSENEGRVRCFKFGG